jgi:hypothetical protein
MTLPTRQEEPTASWLLAGRDNEWLPVFDGTGLGDAPAAGRQVKDNLKVGAELLGGHLSLPDLSVQDLAPGKGWSKSQVRPWVPTATRAANSIRSLQPGLTWAVGCGGTPPKPAGNATATVPGLTATAVSLMDRPRNSWSTST